MKLILPNSTQTRPRRVNERKLPPGSLRLPILPDAEVGALEPRIPRLEPRTADPYGDVSEEAAPARRPKLRIPGTVSMEPDVNQPLVEVTEEPPARRPKLVWPGAQPAVEPEAFEVPATRPRLVASRLRDRGAQPAVEPEAFEVPATRPRLVVPPPPQPTQPDERPRIADPLSYLSNRNDQLRTMPVEENNGRLKSALLGALQGLGDASNRMLASGQKIDGSALAAALGGGVGGLAGGAINPRWDENQARGREIAKNRLDISHLIHQRKAQADIAGQEAETKLKRAQVGELAARPGIKQNEVEAEAREKAINRVVDLYKNLGEYDPDNTRFAGIKAQADALGLNLPAYSKKEKAPRIQKVNGSLFTIGDSGDLTPMIDPRTGQQAVDPSEVADKEGVKPGTRMMVDATAGRQQYQEDKDEIARADKDLDRAEKRGVEARRLVGDFSETMSKADAAKTSREKSALYAEARRKAELISTGYGDLVSHDSNGWPTKLSPPRKRPALSIPKSSSPRRSANYVSPKVSKSELENLLQ